jgi:hypothetical protein
MKLTITINRERHEVDSVAKEEVHISIVAEDLHAEDKEDAEFVERVTKQFAK